ncbi:MAG: mechanosensitive ion channel family protein [Prochlorothrix sp.]
MLQRLIQGLLQPLLQALEGKGQQQFPGPRMRFALGLSLGLALVLLWGTGGGIAQGLDAKPAPNGGEILENLSLPLLTDELTTSSNEGAPVILDGATLFTIQEGFGTASADQRAALTLRQLKRVGQDRSIALNSLQSLPQGDLQTIVAGNKHVLANITPADAQAANTTPAVLSQAYVEVMRSALEQYRYERSWDYLLRSALKTLMMTGILLIIWLALYQLLPKLTQDWQRRSLPSLQFRGVELVPAEETARFLTGLLAKIQFLLSLTAILLYGIAITAFFPWTKVVYLTIAEYFANAPIAALRTFVAYVPNFLSIGFIVLITHYILQFLKLLAHKISDGSIQFAGFYSDWAEPTYRLLELGILALAIVVIFPYLPGFGSPAFQAVSLLLGVIVSFGSSTTVTNAVAGIILIYTRSFNLGDCIQIGEVTGEVEGKNLLVTRIRTFENAIVTVPNANLLSDCVINYSITLRDTGIPAIVTAEVTLGYDIPWTKIYGTLTQAAYRTELVLKEPPPFVLQISLGASSVVYALKVSTEEPALAEVILSDLYQNIQDCCNEAGIEILAPTYSAIRDGNRSTLREAYLPQDYKTPGFNLRPLGNLFQIDLNVGGEKLGS